MRVSRYEQDRERIKEALQEGGIARAIEITGYSSSVISHCISRLGLVDTLKEYRRVNGLFLTMCFVWVTTKPLSLLPMY